MNTSNNWFVYILLCDEKMFYVGITDNLTDRFSKHKNKQSFYTKQFSHLELVYCERYISKYKAAKREQQIKGWSHAKKQKLITGEFGINSYTEFCRSVVGNWSYFVSLLRRTEESPSPATSQNSSLICYNHPTVIQLYNYKQPWEFGSFIRIVANFIILRLHFLNICASIHI